MQCSMRYQHAEPTNQQPGKTPATSYGGDNGCGTDNYVLVAPAELARQTRWGFAL